MAKSNYQFKKRQKELAKKKKKEEKRQRKQEKRAVETGEIENQGDGGTASLTAEDTGNKTENLGEDEPETS